MFCVMLLSDHQTLIYHTKVRWLSKGNMLDKMFSLKSEIFLMSAGKLDLYKFTDEKCIFYLTYLADLIEFLNYLNLKLQVYKIIFKSYDTIQIFSEKISLWQRCLCAIKPNFYRFHDLMNFFYDTENPILNIEND